MTHHPSPIPSPTPSCGEQLRRQLDAAGSITQPTEFQADTRRGQIKCTVAGAEQIGCSVDQVAVGSQTLRGADAGEVRRIGGQVAQRVTYLLEPLRVLEVDAPSATAILRSSPPWRTDQVREYYEARVAPDGMTLERFRKEPNQPRSKAPMELTRQTLERLVNDMADAAG